ncbi:hypothetical protein HS088_TW03G00993 [Tripterygium wilfordii]|uniref:E3 ubiquitin-protein ligase RMA n=1 Tax=Tripterygium wilfordii TaxID=458696 RepID=A0A7J7DWW1_TRIWF|nr:uncharacterized protein LOC119995011 [Tripterygium wilfordii]KAF5750654.1 hypothetical protein HS088_TW03G00993 [Tripterygium wilfordii]
MVEESSDIMNLDLNLGPGPEAGSGSITGEAVNPNDWVVEPFNRIREAVSRRRARQRWRWRHVRMSPEAQNLSMELNQLMGNSGNMTTLHAGEGSVAAEDRTTEVPKMCETNNGFLEDEASEKKDDVVKGVGNDGSFFDCNICLDLSKDPVVTCCGHLFCWSCLYLWIHVHSDAKECPVCKGEVTMKNVTPIYGRGSNNHTLEPEQDPKLKIPLRPHARRVESLRQTIQRNPFGFPVEEMIRRLGSRFDLARDLTPPQDPSNERETAERTNSLLNRFLTSRGMRTEQSPAAPPEEVVDLIQSSSSGPEAGQSSRLQSLLLRRTQSQLQRATTVSSLSTALNSAERLVEAYFRSNTVARHQEQSQPVDDRDSFSSIAAVINSESQIDTAMEIDSLVTLSTSSSRRRNEASRVSDVDSGDSRAPRRRRLN